MKLPITLTAACMVATLGAASADAQHRRGTIDLDALLTETNERFDAIDTNSDGMLSDAEFVAAEVSPEVGPGRRGPHGPKFGMRGDDDGERRAALFAEADTDDSGELSADEFTALPEAMARLARGKHFTRLDDDEDGFVSQEEFQSRYNKLAALDTDGDGSVTRAELGEGRHGDRRGRGRR